MTKMPDEVGERVAIGNTQAMSIDHSSGRDMAAEAAAALNFWQLLEYLTPQSPPKVKLDDCVWEVTSQTPERDMPWNDPRKKLVLKKKIGPNWRFQLFAGVVDGKYFIETVRGYLNVKQIDLSERKPPEPVPCVVLDIDDAGLATGAVFVSSVPWAIARVIEHTGKTTPIECDGFDELEKSVQDKVKDLMVERRLVAAEECATDLEASDTSPESDDDTRAQGSERSAASPDAQLRQITGADVEAITKLVFTLCGWRPEQQVAWRVRALRAPDKAKQNNKKRKVEAARDDPLNSFYAQDLHRIRVAWNAKNIGTGLLQYLRGEDPAGRVDLEQSPETLIRGVHPSLQPAGCWPAKFPLVTAQQFAVNRVMHGLGQSAGLFSVNGPPGTGKTTMLKDIVAAIVVNRADVLAEFSSPESAFKRSLSIENHDFPAFALDKRLRGFGIVVSSANNGAVENITKELPGFGSISPSLDIDYFSVVADSVGASADAKRRSEKQECWGLIAAVLGNKTNRGQFATRFWFSGKQPKDAEPDPLRFRSIKNIIEADEHGALSWPDALANYKAARNKTEKLTELTGLVADAMRALHVGAISRSRAESNLATARESERMLLNAVAAARRAMESAIKEVEETKAKLNARLRLSDMDEAERVARSALNAQLTKLPPGGAAAAKAAHTAAQQAFRSVRDDADKHFRKKPGFLSELFRTEYSKRWNKRDAAFEVELEHARNREAVTRGAVTDTQAIEERIVASRVELAKVQQATSDASATAVQLGLQTTDTAASLRDALDVRERECQATRTALADVVNKSNAAQQAAHDLESRLNEVKAEIRQARSVLEKSPVEPDERRDWLLEHLDRDSMHRAAPYEMRALFDARRELFVAAMNLHKAFIVASWKRLSGTLSAFVDVLTGAIHPSKVSGGVMNLWDAFFLVVPVVSTTFASFPRLFSGVGREELAWLMVDEAGQAAPQQAAGAIWRAKRAVIVGDPLQLEPVVGLPEELMTPLLLRTQAESQWAPPATSAQTLADRANRLGMYVGEPDAERRLWVGSPLLVHRRCLNPMFEIANLIAYDNKMVYGAGSDTGDVGIGPSRWIDMPVQQSDGHWVRAQADKAVELVQAITNGALKDADGRFKTYIVTPFRAVAMQMRDLLGQSYRTYSEEDVRRMVGTVHTFQGKEAEHVIFLLGGNPTGPGVISYFAGAKPNLVNVAVTRAKRRLYVIGDRSYWTGPSDVHGIFTRLADALSD